MSNLIKLFSKLKFTESDYYSLLITINLVFEEIIINYYYYLNSNRILFKNLFECQVDVVELMKSVASLTNSLGASTCTK